MHVARSLGRAVPLSPQLILAPTATVTALQSDTNATNNTQSASAQVHTYTVIHAHPKVPMITQTFLICIHEYTVLKTNIFLNTIVDVFSKILKVYLQDYLVFQL